MDTRRFAWMHEHVPTLHEHVPTRHERASAGEAAAASWLARLRAVADELRVVVPGTDR